MWNIDRDRSSLGGGLGSLLGLGHGDGGTDDFLLLAAQLGGDGSTTALLFRDGRGSGFTFGVPGTKAIANLGDPGGKRGLRIVR